MRHDLAPSPVAPAASSMVEASVAAALIAAGDLPTPHPACVDTTVFGAVDLAPVAMTADQHLLAAQAAQKEAAARAVGELASHPRCARDLVDTIRGRDYYDPAIVLRHGVGRGAELNCQVRLAPRLVQRSAATVALTAYPC